MSEVTRDQALSMIGKVWAGNAGDELFRLFEDGDYQAAYELASAKVEEQGRLNNLDERHIMEITTGPPYEGEPTQYVNVFFPDLGNMTITYETRSIGEGDKDNRRPVISVDFSVKKIDVIDAYGGDRSID